MDVVFGFADWLRARWWGKPLGWLIYGVWFLIAAALLLMFAGILLALIGGVFYAVAVATLSSNALSAARFVATAILALIAAGIWWFAFREGAAMVVGIFAVAVGIGWIISIPSDTPKPGSRAAFCAKHECIGGWESARGHRVRCADGMWSFSGGIQGACSSHGGTGGGGYFGTN